MLTEKTVDPIIAVNIAPSRSAHPNQNRRHASETTRSCGRSYGVSRRRKHELLTTGMALRKKKKHMIWYEIQAGAIA